MQYTKGQRVCCIKAYDDNKSIVGQHGTIARVSLSGNTVLVNFDNPIGGHTGRGNYGVPDGHGWYIPTDGGYLVPIINEKKYLQRLPSGNNAITKTTTLADLVNRKEQSTLYVMKP